MSAHLAGLLIGIGLVYVLAVLPAQLFGGSLLPKGGREDDR